MKRLILILVLLVSPLQMSWAAASGYCQHEQNAATQHFGHHAHQHQAPDKSDSGGSTSPTFHADCAFCHLGCAGAVTSSLDVPSSALAFPVVSPENDFLLPIFLEGPERPNWAPAV